MVNLLGYKLGSCFCREATKHGGVAIFIKNNISYKPIVLMDFNLAYHAEFCGIELANNILLITVYRSGLGSFNEVGEFIK